LIFFKAYIEKTGAGKEGVTNHIHMLGSRHFAYYIKMHGNLYKFSKQGWESLNGKFMLSFFNHTQRGGNFGTDNTERPYLRSIFMFFQQELLWILGVVEQHFLNAQLDLLTVLTSIIFNLSNFVLDFSLHLNLD
jgi:hypothetical protein